MKIECSDKPEVKLVILYNVKPGECFLYRGKFYMRAGAFFGTFAVNLSNGEYEYLDNNVKVQPVEAKVVYTTKAKQ